jgi:hypothetical protein
MTPGRTPHMMMMLMMIGGTFLEYFPPRRNWTTWRDTCARRQAPTPRTMRVRLQMELHVGLLVHALHPTGGSLMSLLEFQGWSAWGGPSQPCVFVCVCVCESVSVCACVASRVVGDELQDWIVIFIIMCLLHNTPCIGWGTCLGGSRFRVVGCTWFMIDRLARSIGGGHVYR